MSRIKITIPEHFSFSMQIPVRITDLNYGGHVGNDRLLSLIHEARVQYLASLGYSEMDLAGVGMIMADAGIEFRKELLYGHLIEIEVTAANISKAAFDLFYRVSIIQDGQKQLAALVKTGMICFDYTSRKVVVIPEEAVSKLI